MINIGTDNPLDVIILILAILAGALIGWLAIRLSGYSGSYNRDIEKIMRTKNFKKWVRDLKKKREVNMLSENHKEA